MSQIYKNLASGPVPPSVPTAFTADDGNIAVPVANNLNLFSRDTIEDNANGIQTTADPNLSDNFFVEITNRTRVTATTVGAVNATANIFTPLAASAITFVVSISAYDAANNETTGGELVGVGRRSGGGATVVVGTNDTFFESDAGLVASDWDIVTDGTLIQVQFTGVAGRTINWSAVFIYDQVQ